MVSSLLNKAIMNESRIARKRDKRLNESVKHEDRLEAVLEELEKILNDELASHSGVKLRIGRGDFDEESGSFKMDVVGFDEDAFDDEELRNFEDSVEEEIRAFFKKRDPEAIVEVDPERDFTFQITTGCLNESEECEDDFKELKRIYDRIADYYPEIELFDNLGDQGNGTFFLEFDYNANAFETETDKQEFENKLEQAVEDWGKDKGYTVNRSEDEDVQMAFWIEKPEELDEDASEDKKFQYRLLDRLKQDCEYFLKAGGRNPKHLWAGSPEKQVAKMREIYGSFADDEKPEWLTADQIDEYEKQMLGECEETCVECGKPIAECECGKDDEKKPIIEAVAEFREIIDPMVGYVIPSDLNDAFTQKALSDKVNAADLDLRRVGDNFVVGKILEERMDTEDLAEFFNDLDYHVFKNALADILDGIVDPEKAEKAGYGEKFIKKDEIFDALGQPRWFIK